MIAMVCGKRKAHLGNTDIYRKRLRFEGKHKFVSLLDLPQGPLHLVLSKVSPDKQILLRRASKALRLEHSQFMMHKYKRYVKHFMRGDPIGIDYCVMNILNESAKFYINAGYDVIFTRSLVSSKDLCELDLKAEPIHEIHMQQFLSVFYTHLEAIPRYIYLKQRRLIYTVTLLNLLRQFQRFRIVSSKTPLFHWQLNIEVCNIYFGLRHDVDIQNITDEEKLADFVGIIAELLASEMCSEEKFRYVEIGNIYYIYGLNPLDADAKTRVPRINFRFSILGPHVVRKLLESAINGTLKADSDLVFPTVTDSPLNIQLEVKTIYYNEIIGIDHMHMCIVPTI